ncbi:Co2+/Mg2+ efflux protein ApaG [Methylovirgula sp. 4M-Z18]|uniref:Co2+/Mg2+ efflux protein ApaG n=1 Tax=Methylovirgula sp. 4M-Z18 TaxID=2293567 RepID=UPI000E2E7253|nr:Co2+/Mg2+ efflux protein ApaG [Methylovirgula sp. 4M-Z18]RFB78753.1 Co2+/Mg2+ efflux protein ApaG [Methylovirgula sp. 4M-Z18]
MYSKTTGDIEVLVTPEYLPDHSDPAEDRYVWAYTIEIVNHGSVEVQLLSRHWLITDGHGHRQEVRGPGVVGEQPVLSPRTRFRYTSGCPLTTPSGIMVGSYQMIDANGHRFDIAIPAFSLDLPDAKPVLN